MSVCVTSGNVDVLRIKPYFRLGGVGGRFRGYLFLFFFRFMCIFSLCTEYLWRFLYVVKEFEYKVQVN